MTLVSSVFLPRGGKFIQYGIFQVYPGIFKNIEHSYFTPGHTFHQGFSRINEALPPLFQNQEELSYVVRLWRTFALGKSLKKKHYELVFSKNPPPPVSDLGERRGLSSEGGLSY